MRNFIFVCNIDSSKLCFRWCCTAEKEKVKDAILENVIEDNLRSPFLQRQVKTEWLPYLSSI